MTRSRATITLADERFRSGLRKRLALFLLGVTVLSTALWAQQEAGPDVVYAVAPEWPALDSTKAEQPHKEVVLVRVEVDGFGNVVNTQLLTSKSAYSDSALRAAELWKFAEPVTDRSAKLLAMTATLKFNFQILPRNTSRDELGTAFIPPYETSLSRWVRRKR